jgi:hypothetical protein
LASKLLNTLTPPNVFEPVVATEPLNISNAVDLEANDAESFWYDAVNDVNCVSLAYDVSKLELNNSNADNLVASELELVKKLPLSIVILELLINILDANDAELNTRFTIPELNDADVVT